ncbi:EscT/YscT/HrcT family type III secretion system export apparatus protein [Paraburkholderia hayleyella]|uniref:EscT/YscT/HrcT family type III secretion system export apparatus protein n=1 Tax=Paraburkholderia hayleyella TaxID=2152889 RepID=UPI001291EF92|nr:flagellar biosynthetic protein FliR [Paraburkholderia hayleyella]
MDTTLVMLAEQIKGLAFCMVRPAVALSVIPLSSNTSPALALRLPLIGAIALLPGLSGPPASLYLALPIEALMGFVIGLVASVPFVLAQTAGAVLDQQSGYTIASIFDPLFSRESSPVETILSHVAALTMFTLPGLFLLIGLIVESWVIWPPGSHGNLTGWMRQYAEHDFPRYFAHGLGLAAPWIGMLLLVEIAVVMQTRSIRQMNPFITALPLKVALLTLSLALTLGPIATHLMRVAQTLLPSLDLR